MLPGNFPILNKFRVLTANWIPAFAGMTILLLIVLFISPKSSFAANEFSTSYDITYAVPEDGNTEVTEIIKLKNLTDKFFPSSFSVTLPGTDISEITATDSQGNLDVQSKQENSNTKLTVTFSNQQIIGLNKEYTWTLKFKDKSIARNLSKVWNVNIPKINQQTQVESLNLTLTVPSAFGDPDFISPKEDRVSESGGRINLNYNKNQLLTTGISAIFGSSLNFEFENSYLLKNNGLFPEYKKIIVPGNSPYQKAYISSIEPRPENTSKDELGNTLATFKINPAQQYEVKVKGNLKTFLKSQSKEVLTQKDREFYSIETKFWDKNNPTIKAKLSEILLDQKPADDYAKARLIDKYVSNFLQFDATRINKNDFVRFGSVTALNNPEKALSAEFIDLETALLRAAGIPTRQVIGSAYRSGTGKPFSYFNQNLHTWLEFYDASHGWVIADPTWEHTTQGADFFDFNDLNHLALAFSNSTDEFVLPDNINTKIFEGELTEQKGADLDIKVDKEILSGFPSAARIKITNLGNFAFPASSLQIDTSKILLDFPGEQPATTKTINTPEIPPFGNLEYNFNLKTGAIWQSYQDAFQVKFAGADDTRVVTVVPVLSYKIFAVEIIGGLGLIVLFYILVLLIHHKSSRSHNKN